MDYNDLDYQNENIILKEFLKNFDIYSIKTTFVKRGTSDLFYFFINEKNKNYYLDTIRFINKKQQNKNNNLKEEKFCFLVREVNIYLQEKYDTVSKFASEIIVKYILLLSQCTLVRIIIEVNGIENLKYSLEDIYNNCLNYNNNVYFFRGQTNYEWNLIPSMIRNLNDNVKINMNFFNKKYLTLKLKDKYYEMFGKDKIDYLFLSFMQHACSYSPFIDFTKSNIIGLSFALSNPNFFNDFTNKNSSLFIVSIDSNEILRSEKKINEFLQEEYQLIYLDRKTLGFGENVSFKENEEEKILFLSDFKTIISLLTPKYKLIDLPTNDRMKYQKGVFLVFYGCICANDTIFYQLNNKFKLLKVKINKMNKRIYLEKIYKNYRFYDPEHLMKPYLYFNE